jgi:hypothetical protein
MLKAIVTGRVPFRRHLEECAECRWLFEALSDLRIVEACRERGLADDLAARLGAIPLLTASSRRTRVVSGRTVYDSWTRLQPAQLRDVARGFERSLRLKASDVTLELAAERLPRAWEFTARAYRRGAVVSEDFVLKVGRRRLISNPQRCYQWSSQRPIRSLELQSPRLRLVFKDVWRRLIEA